MKTPGTVSKILWHFTGGPLWDDVLNKQKMDLKSSADAYEILLKIIESSELRISNYSELIKVIIPKVTRSNFVNNVKERITETNVYREIKSSKVCCLADIPIQHLGFHSNRYGKFAIGFHRRSVVENNFNPVFYSLENSNIINSIYSGFTSIRNSDTSSILYAVDTIKDSVEAAESEIELFKFNNDVDDLDIDLDINSEIYTAEVEVDNIGSDLDDARSSIEDFVAFVKTFDISEFNSIYCEREWRSLTPFKFSWDDIAMIILPRNDSFYDKLISSNIVPAGIPILPWEDLVEH